MSEVCGETLWTLAPFLTRATVYAGANAVSRGGRKERGLEDSGGGGDAPRSFVLSPPACSVNVFT